MDDNIFVIKKKGEIDPTTAAAGVHLEDNVTHWREDKRRLKTNPVVCGFITICTCI